MEAESIERRALRAACSVAEAEGVPAGEAAVIHSASNVLVHLRASPVVARVMSGTVALHDDPERWLSREVSVLGFLDASGLAIRPSPLIAPGPYESDGLWMTFWEFVDCRGWTEPRDPERLGGALRELHEALAGFPGELAGFADLQADIERLRQQLRPAPELSGQRIESLGERVAALGETVFSTQLPAQALHGDASLSNLLTTRQGLVWNDFEDTFRGPVHWDLAGYLMSLEWAGADPAFLDQVLDAYGSIDRAELAPFMETHELYDEIWRLYDVQRRR